MGAAAHAQEYKAQQPGKVGRIGFISVAFLKIEDVFFQHLRERSGT
jgi:hypothetical protein